MEKKTLDERISEYFKKNNVLNIPVTDKEKLELIKEIILKTKVDADLFEMEHDNKMVIFKEKEELTYEDIEYINKIKCNFINTIHDMEINTIEGNSLIGPLKYKIKKKRINKIKSFFRK